MQSLAFLQKDESESESGDVTTSGEEEGLPLLERDRGRRSSVSRIYTYFFFQSFMRS